MHSELSWRWRCRKIGLASREVVALQAHLHVRGLLSWKAHMTVKLAIMPLGITSTTTRRIKRRLINNNNNSLDIIIIIIIIIINQPPLKSNRLLLERNFWLWWVFKSHSFSQLPSTITEKRCGKNSIRPIIILAPWLRVRMHQEWRCPFYTVNAKYSHLIKEVYPGSAAAPSPLSSLTTATAIDCCESMLPLPCFTKKKYKWDRGDWFLIFELLKIIPVCCTLEIEMIYQWL